MKRSSRFALPAPCDEAAFSPPQKAKCIANFASTASYGARRPSADVGRAVGAPVEECFGDVLAHDAIRSGQIGDRSRDAGDAVEGAGARYFCTVASSQRQSLPRTPRKPHGHGFIEATSVKRAANVNPVRDVVATAKATARIIGAIR
jgi:hypothetical protein